MPIRMFIWALVVYLSLSFLGALIPVNLHFRESPGGIRIYILSNGVHTDFVMPVRTHYFNWVEFFGPQAPDHLLPQAEYLAFGWGDKRFYLFTPEWSDLRVSVAIGALIPPGESAVHVTPYPELEEDKLCIPLHITDSQFVRLTRYLLNGFKTDSTGTPVLVDHPGYGYHDRFYEARGSFHLFKSCNTWTQQGLKESGIRCPAWTVFDKPILYHLRRLKKIE